MKTDYPRTESKRVRLSLLIVLAAIAMTYRSAFAEIEWVSTPPLTNETVTWVARITNDTGAPLNRSWQVWEQDFECDDLLRRGDGVFIPPGGSALVDFRITCSGSEVGVYREWGLFVSTNEREAEIYIKYGNVYTSPVALGGPCSTDGPDENRRAFPVRESVPNASPGSPCPLLGQTDGTAANYRWYNVCSGYVWLWTGWATDDAVGIRFGGAEQPEVNDGNDIKRVITYYRNIVPNYFQTVCVTVDVDQDSDGRPDDPEAPLLTDLDLDPGLRWNCSEFNADIPCGVTSLIVRSIHSGGYAPSFVTDGFRAETCYPDPPQRSYRYLNESSEPFIFNDRPVNLLYWLVLDNEQPCINAVQHSSWGKVKGLFN